MREIRPDAAILHVQRADKEGNAHAWGNFGVMREAAFAAQKVILTCEEIVDHDVILSDPNRNVIPGFRASSVVHQPLDCTPRPPKATLGGMTISISSTIRQPARERALSSGYKNGCWE